MLASRQSSLTSVRRDAWVEVDLGALEYNVGIVKSWLQPPCQLMAVVKSDAYGHGAPGVGPVFASAGAEWFGVASVDEAVQLREEGIKNPILLLGPCPFWAINTCLDSGIDFTVTSKSQIKDIQSSAAKAGIQARLHLKVDSGMHRLGASIKEIPDILSLISSSSAVRLQGIFSHLARADHEKTTRDQNSQFQQAVTLLSDQGVPVSTVHLASGEAARRFPDTHYDMVRVGLYLYGLEPKAISDAVIPALSLRARINHIQQIDAGESAGYDHTWTARRPSRLASVPVGYADGVDRKLSNRITGLLSGREVKQVGLISMDQMLFDITDLPAAEEGDVVTLIGSENGHKPGTKKLWPEKTARLHLATWANMLDTITYELACRLRVRLPRIYTRHQWN